MLQPNPIQGHTTVVDIDQLLHGVASRIKWSSPSIRASQTTLTSRNRGDLESIYRHFSATEAKWFTRLLLKNYEPLILDQNLIYRLCDPVLPYVLKVQDDFGSAVALVQQSRTRLLPNAACSKSRTQQVLATVKPRLGVKVGRQFWYKGRSIKHCLDMGSGRMSVQEKVDGEYCQIHVDPSKEGSHRIQIFSKSGKDSTEDRKALIRCASSSPVIL
jgi:DNA ligase-4